jgi:hypothetical protein
MTTQQLLNGNTLFYAWNRETNSKENIDRGGYGWQISISVSKETLEKHTALRISHFVVKSKDCMMFPVRVCLLIFDESFKVDANNRITGAVANVVSGSLSIVMGLNYTFIRKSSDGVLIDAGKKMYDGCIGSMQRNESDVMYSWNQYPFDAPNLTQKVDGSGRIGILSGYRQVKISERNATDVMDMMEAFTADVWLIHVAFTAILAFPLTCSIEIRSEMQSQPMATT